MNIFIGGAWPYANGSLHIGHIAALLPGDVLARYHRSKGDEVCYVSGSDCHGTPISFRAKKEGLEPQDIALRYHNEFKDCFNSLGFSYDYYSNTLSDDHKTFVKDFIKTLYENNYIYSKEIEQAFCDNCNHFLPDRYVVGVCPECKSKARGDQCDSCGSLLEPSALKDCVCSICGLSPVFKTTNHLFLALSKFQSFLEEYIAKQTHFRLNAINLSNRYLKEGLKDRAITRDLDWGIDAPIEGFEDKKIYVWIEAVLGYLSACKEWCEGSSNDFAKYWSPSSRHYYIHGKDNIPFHTIILPSLLEAFGNLHLPDRVFSSEYLTLENKKISTSNNWAVWLPYLINKYNADSIRYFFIINNPQKRDTDFSFREFINSHNGELLGAYGNFVNRTLVFINKNFGNFVPSGNYSKEINHKISDLYLETGNLIEEGNFKEALENIFALIRYSNKYFDEEHPWITVRENMEKCRSTIYTCVQIIGNLANLLQPFLPFSSLKIKRWLSISHLDWSILTIPANIEVVGTELLFQRIDRKIIEEEIANLHQSPA